MPGNRPVTVPAIVEAPIAFVMFSFETFIISVILCFGRFMLEFSDIKRLLIPKIPDSNGNSGSFNVFMFKTIIPKIPEIRNTIALKIFFFQVRSFKIMTRLTINSIYPTIGLIVAYISGVTGISSGISSVVVMRQSKLPITVSFTAS